MIITLLVGGHLVIAHRISVGQLVAFNTYMVLLTWPIIAVGWVVNIFQRGTASVKRIDGCCAADRHRRQRADSHSSRYGAPGEIEFRDLNSVMANIRHPGVLRGISLRFPPLQPGHCWPNRSGNPPCSTSYPRYEAPEGSLLIDGAECRLSSAVLSATSAWCRRRLFFSALRSGNLAFGAPHASTEELLKAGRSAHISSGVRRISQGFETMVGERGVRFPAAKNSERPSQALLAPAGNPYSR